MFTIRQYTEEDFPLLNSWWMDWEKTPAWKELLPEESTFIVEYENKPIASACLYLIFGVQNAAMVEHLISDKHSDPVVREEAVDLLVSYMEQVAMQCGYKSLVCFGYNEKVKDRYKELGYQETLQNVSTFSKRLGS